jgi:Spy/CpxP family protein refolding chaperone
LLLLPRLWALPAWRSPQILRPPPLPRLLGKMMMHHKGPGMHNEMMMFKDLNLTDAQKQRYPEERTRQMKRPPLEERRAMHDIIASDSFDKAKAEAQIDKMAEQHKARMLAHLETRTRSTTF